VCFQCESKGESGSSGSTLNSNREREERGGGRGKRRPALAIEGRGHLGQEWGKGETTRFECEEIPP
jgi:hypothetical protein